MKRHTVTLVVLAAAVVCYVAGWNDGGAALLAAGGILEMIFWSRIICGSRVPSGGKPDA